MRYVYGEGVPQDLGEAVKLYTLAADQGDAFGQYSLGVCYHQGIGVNKNESKAIELYKLAAAQGDENAQYNLNALGIR
jgi:hypothetical protein